MQPLFSVSLHSVMSFEAHVPLHSWHYRIATNFLARKVIILDEPRLHGRFRLEP